MEVTMSTSEARQKVATILADAGIKMTAQYVPTTYDPKSKEWQGIAWKVAFHSASRGMFVTDYKQGIGHLPESVYPKDAGHRMTMVDAQNINKTLQTGIAYGGKYPNVPNGKLTPPEAADVIGCLLQDADAVNYSTYEAYAADMGMDPDSRAGERIFMACREIALNLYRVFSPAVMEALRPLAQEL